MAFAEYARYDATGLAHLVRKGDVSPRELVDEAISRIERHNPTLNAVVYKAFDEARAAASDALPDGPFKGVPFLIKDINVPVKNWPMSNGSAYLKGYVSDSDCELTLRYRRSGVILLGKTNTPEFGIPGTTEGRFLGICRNPWNHEHSSGGSSGGAAAAVASAMVPMAHGSDGLGSIRIPAAQCGLVGLKPTQGRNPGGPDDGGRAHGFIVDHVLTRSVRDSAAMLDATADPEDDAPYAPLHKERPFVEELSRPAGRLRIAFTMEVPRETQPHPEIARVFAQTVKLLGELGHTMIERPSLGIDWRTLYRAQSCVSGAMFAASVAQWAQILGRPPRDEDFEPLARASWHGSQRLTSEQIGWGFQTLRRMTRELLRQWRDFDVLLSPTTLTPPPQIGHLDPVGVEPREFHRRQSFVFGYTPPANMTGQPSLSLPLGMSDVGLPIGMMFTARFGDEATLLRLGRQLEEAAPWDGRHARLWD